MRRLIFGMSLFLLLSCDSPENTGLENIQLENIPFDVQEAVSQSCNRIWVFQQDKEDCVITNLVAYEKVLQFPGYLSEYVDRCLGFHGEFGRIDFVSAVSCIEDSDWYLALGDLILRPTAANTETKEACDEGFETAMTSVNRLNRMESLYLGDLEVLWQQYYGTLSELPDNMNQNERNRAIERLEESDAFTYSGFNKGIEALYRTSYSISLGEITFLLGAMIHPLSNCIQQEFYNSRMMQQLEESYHTLLEKREVNREWREQFDPDYPGYNR